MLYHLLKPYGSHGKVVEIVSNFIRLKFLPGRAIYEYECRFDPIVDHRFVISVFISYEIL